MVSELSQGLTMAAPTSSSINSAASSHNPFLFLSNLPNYVSIKLDSSNFILWNFQISAVLRGFSLFGFVDGSSVCPERFLRSVSGERTGQENPEFFAWIAQDQALLAMINATLSPSALSYVVGQTTAQGVWTTLSRRFTSVSRSNVLDLKLALHNVKMNGDSIDVYLQRIKTLRDNLTAVSVFFSDEEILHVTIRGLPPEYHGLRTAIRTRNDQIPLEDLHVLLMSEERSLAEDQESMNSLPNPLAMAAFRHQSNNKGKSGGNNNKGKTPIAQTGSNLGPFLNNNGGSHMMYGGSSGYGSSSSSHGNPYPSGGSFSNNHEGSSSYGPEGGFQSSYGRSQITYGGSPGTYGDSPIVYGDPQANYGDYHMSPVSHGQNQRSSSNFKNTGSSNSYGNNNKQVSGTVQANCYSSSNNNVRQICQICNLPGHTALDCYHRMDFSYQGRHPPARLAAMAAVSSPDTSNYWLTDSGANNHVTAEMSNLAINTEYDGTDQVAVGNGQGLSISHIGQTHGEGPLQRTE